MPLAFTSSRKSSRVRTTATDKKTGKTPRKNKGCQLVLVDFGLVAAASSAATSTYFFFKNGLFPFWRCHFRFCAEVAKCLLCLVQVDRQVDETRYGHDDLVRDDSCLKLMLCQLTTRIDRFNHNLEKLDVTLITIRTL